MNRNNKRKSNNKNKGFKPSFFFRNIGDVLHALHLLCMLIFVIVLSIVYYNTEMSMTTFGLVCVIYGIIHLTVFFTLTNKYCDDESTK